MATDLLCLRPAFLTNLAAVNPVEVFCHTEGRPVVMYHARFAPPWSNTSVVLEGPHGRGAVAVLSTWARPRLVSALTESGFELDIREASWKRGTRDAGWW